MATDLAQMLAGQRERLDPGDRAASTPPDDESLLWHGVFVAETYGPSHIPGLLRSIEKLGWDRAQSPATKDSLRDWILSSRSQAVGGGFWPLNLTREGGTGVDTQVFGGTPLPHGVAFARGLVLTPTPALTVLVLFFAFEDEPASRVEEVLRERTVSEGRRVASGWVIESVPNVRLDRVAEVRRQLRALGDFLSEFLPGACAIDLDGEHPACEVVTTERWDPLEPDSRHTEQTSGRSYLWVIGLESSLRSWTASGFDGWRLELPDVLTRSPAMILCAKADRVTGPGSKADPGSPTEQVSSLLFHQGEGVIALWACTELLSGYGALLGRIRDEVREEARGLRAGLTRLRELRHRLLGDAADARTLAEELTRAVDEGSTQPWCVELDFAPLQPDYWKDGRLHELLLREIGGGAKVVVAAERQVRADLELDSQVGSAMANLQSQRWARALTALLGVATIGLGAYQIWG